MNINKLYQIQYKISGLLLILLGSTVIFGWIIKSEKIIRIYAGFSPMQFNTAICFILSGIILLFIKRKIAFIASVILLIIAGTTFLEHVTTQNYGIDEYFMKSFINTVDLYPGRMAPNSTISFALFAIANILFKIKDDLLVQNLQMCMLFIISSLGVVVIVSYCFNLNINHGTGQYAKMALHTAIGLVILSQSLLIYISQQKKNSSFLSLFITFGLLTITFLGWQTLKNHQELNLSVVVEKELQNIINLINSNLTERTKAFSRITYRWLATPGGTPYKSWVNDVNHYIIDQPGYVGIEWVDNNFIIRWAEPKNNNKIVGYNLSKDTHRREFMEESAKQKKITISSTIDLLQGNKGILLIDPLIKNDKVLGFMIGVIDTKIFFDHIFENTNHDEKIITIRNQNELIYSTYNYNHDNNIDDTIKWRNKKNLMILGQQFTAEIIPKKNLYDKVISSNLETLILLMGILVSILSGVTATYLITTKKLQKEVFKVNDWLKGILECTTEYIAAIDTDFKFMAFNQAYSYEVYRLFKIHLSVGMSFMTLADKMDEPNREKIIGLWHKIFKGENCSTIEEFKLGNNKILYYDIHFNPIYNSNGTLIGASHIATNINKRIKNEKLIHDDRNKLKLLVNDLESRNSELFLLKELITMLNINDSFEQFKEIFTHYACKLFPHTSGIIYLQSQSSMSFDAEISWNNIINHVTSFQADHCLALLQNQTYIVENTQKQLPCRHVSNNSDNCNNDNIKNYICIPLLSRGKKLGLAYIEFLSSNNNVTNKKYDFIQLVFEQVSLILYNIQLKNHLKSQSIHDSLTELYNKRYIDEYLNQEIIITKRYSKQLSIIMLDIDHFKSINDTYGHFCGDMVLEKFSSVLKNNFRESDLIARWGGEEFLVIFKETSIELIKTKCEKLRKNIECLSIDFHGQVIKFTVSMGVAEYDLIETKEDLLKKADSALYKAKKQGRNRIIIAS